MRGKKAKRLRKAGLKSGPQPKAELTEAQEKKIQKRIDDAKKPYSNQGGMLYGYAEKAKARAKRDTAKKYAEQDANKTIEIAQGTLQAGDILHYDLKGLPVETTADTL